MFPFIKFPGVDTMLGPEMKSTGEVMGIDREFGLAFAKAEVAAGNPLPRKGTIFISVREEDRDDIEQDRAPFVAAKGFSSSPREAPRSTCAGSEFACDDHQQRCGRALRTAWI